MKAEENVGVLPERVETTEIVKNGVFDTDPVKALEQASILVKVISDKCIGANFIAEIKNKKTGAIKKYPKVEWWTTVGSVLGLFPYVVHCIRREHADKGYFYEARVEVRDRSGYAVTSAEAICSTNETRWGYADEYAIKSMAQTRATAKAYRIGLSFLATLAGLEATPAEEVPPGGFGNHAEKSDKPPIKRKHRTPDQKKKATRMHEWLVAKCNGGEYNVGKTLAKKCKELDMEPMEHFNDLTGSEIDQLWMAWVVEVEKFEKATGGK